MFLAKTKASVVRLCKVIPFKQLEREGSLRGEFEQPGRHEDRDELRVWLGGVARSREINQMKKKFRKRPAPEFTCPILPKRSIGICDASDDLLPSPECARSA